jgi:hypothetical protein
MSETSDNVRPDAAAGAEGSSGPWVGSGEPQPEPQAATSSPPLTQVAIAQQIAQLLNERQLYRETTRRTLSQTTEVIDELSHYSNATTGTDKIVADDFEKIDKTLDLGRAAASRLEELGGERRRLDVALKQAEAQSFKTRAWLVGGALFILFLIIANAR